MRRVSMILAAGCASALMACGGASVPQAEVAEATAAVQAADAVGAEAHPNAALHLKMARDEMARAEQYIEDGDRLEAMRALDRAEIDANLARQLAHAAKAKAEAHEAQQKVHELRNGAR